MSAAVSADTSEHAIADCHFFDCGDESDTEDDSCKMLYTCM